MGTSLDEYLSTNRMMSEVTREAADRVGVDRIFFVSSGAVYGALQSAVSSESANPYATIKLEDEAHFKEFAHGRARRKVLTVRLFNLSGPYINKLGSYALSSFIEQARKQDVDTTIRINAGRPVIRSYVGVGNLLDVAFARLLDDTSESYECFDTAGEREVEVLELAETVRRLVNPSVSIVRPQFSHSPIDRYVGDGTRFRSLAQGYGISLHDLNQQVSDTADYLGAS